MPYPKTHFITSASLGLLGYWLTRTIFLKLLQRNGQPSTQDLLQSPIGRSIHRWSLSLGLFLSIGLHHFLDYFYVPILQPLLRLMWMFMTFSGGGWNGGDGGISY